MSSIVHVSSTGKDVEVRKGDAVNGVADEPFETFAEQPLLDSLLALHPLLENPILLHRNDFGMPRLSRVLSFRTMRTKKRLNMKSR